MTSKTTNMIQLEYVIGTALYKHNGILTFEEVYAIVEKVTTDKLNEGNYYIEATADLIRAEIEANDDCFVYHEEEIYVTSHYKTRLHKIKEYFYDDLSDDIKALLDRVC